MIRRVFDGGAGCDSGGKDDRSSDRGERDRFFDKDTGEEAVDAGGELEGMFCVWIGEGGCRRTSVILPALELIC